MAPGSIPGQQHTASCLRWDARLQSPLRFLSAPSQHLVRFLALSRATCALRRFASSDHCRPVFHVSASRLACPSTPAMI